MSAIVDEKLKLQLGAKEYNRRMKAAKQADKQVLDELDALTPATTQAEAEVSPWRLREGTSVITSDDGDVAIVVGQVVGGKLASKRAQQNAETIIAAPQNQQRIAELGAALRDTLLCVERRDDDSLANAANDACAVLNRKEGER